jgi:ligand-binding sensor domain-containing protein
MIDRQGRFWAGTQSGLARRDSGGWKVFKRSDGMLDDMVNVVLEDAYGAIWAGSHVAPWGGLNILENGAFRRFNLANGMPHVNIACIYEDPAGAVWVGTGFADAGGLVRFARRGDRWEIDRVWRRADGLAGARVRSIFEDRDGTLWVGSEFDGVARFRNGKAVQILTTKDGMPENEATSILQAPDGALWMSTPGGVARIDPSALARMKM